MIGTVAAILGTAGGILLGKRLLGRRDAWNRKTAVLVAWGCALIFLAGIWLMGLYGYHWLKILRYLTIMYGLLLLAVIDAREKIIPNSALAMLAGFRMVLLIGDVFVFPELAAEIMISAGAGLAGGGILFLAASAAVRKGLGMGDVKLVAVMGFYLGFKALMSSLIIILTLTALAGTGLLLFKKISLKSELPFAPFAAAGTVIALLMGF